MSRKIIHVDMDAFYASVEQRDCPAYRGKPLVVGGRPEQRGAVAAASYEARRYGIHSAMPARTAIQRCPQLIFVKPRFEVYRQVSQQIRAIFQRYTEVIEPLSLDEAYLDVTANKLGESSAMAIARAIKREIQDETQLTASAGVSINKFLAKTASGWQKPDGLTLIAPDQAAEFVAALPIAKFHGIGQVTAHKLNQLGIHTGSDLRAWAEADLVRHFGKAGHHFFQIARAIDDRPVNPHRLRKSIGAEQSFFPDLTEVTRMETELTAIAQVVFARLQQHQRYGYTLTLKIKYGTYEQLTRSETRPVPFDTVAAIHACAQALLHQHRDRDRPVRLLGITLSNLVDAAQPYAVQLSLPLVTSATG